VQGCGGAPEIACDEPGDCSAGQCCAQLDLSTGQPLLSTSCAPSCPTPVCVVPQDCAAGAACKPFAGAFGPKLNACQ
jgi:hypothetical protein